MDVVVGSLSYLFLFLVYLTLPVVLVLAGYRLFQFLARRGARAARRGWDDAAPADPDDAPR